MDGPRALQSLVHDLPALGPVEIDKIEGRGQWKNRRLTGPSSTARSASFASRSEITALNDEQAPFYKVPIDS